MSGARRALLRLLRLFHLDLLGSYKRLLAEGLAVLRDHCGDGICASVFGACSRVFGGLESITDGRFGWGRRSLWSFVV